MTSMTSEQYERRKQTRAKVRALIGEIDLGRLRDLHDALSDTKDCTQNDGTLQESEWIVLRDFVDVLGDLRIELPVCAAAFAATEDAVQVALPHTTQTRAQQTLDMLAENNYHGKLGIVTGPGQAGRIELNCGLIVMLYDSGKAVIQGRPAVAGQDADVRELLRVEGWKV